MVMATTLVATGPDWSPQPPTGWSAAGSHSTWPAALAWHRRGGATVRGRIRSCWIDPRGPRSATRTDRPCWSGGSRELFAWSALFRKARGFRRSCNRSEEHTSELQSLMRISYAVFCLKKKKNQQDNHTKNVHT